MASRTWLITGAGRGLGRAFVDAALGNGDRVVATARKPDDLRAALDAHGDRALVLPLDVTDADAVRQAVELATEAFGGVDVLVNNAGYGLSGGVEEVSEQQARDQFETNFFGALWMTRAVLPQMRARRAGHIVQISSVAGLTAAPNIGIYAASKWALEAMSEALTTEVAPLGIRVTIVEPSGFKTDWGGSSMDRAAPIADYDDVLEARRQSLRGPLSPDVYRGVPALAAQRLVELVESEDPPTRLLMGNMAVELATAAYERRLREFAKWEHVSRSVDATP
ncbi:SDR family oxidoreductase [Pseudonocardia ailaonensis]|uniref:SDR family oxidoreductase n=1 Tax=Pseudonocardia ailaonensis TaxID=367279 RepID=A0ABN2NKL4_9PSEU